MARWRSVVCPARGAPVMVPPRGWGRCRGVAWTHAPAPLLDRLGLPPRSPVMVGDGRRWARHETPPAAPSGDLA